MTNRYGIIEATDRPTFEAVVAKGWGCYPLWLERSSLESARRTVAAFSTDALPLLIIDTDAGEIVQ